MNPEFPTDPRQALEASLTAMLLGELPPDQVEFLRRAIEQDAELARIHARLKETIGFVREAEAPLRAQEPATVDPVKLSATRRDQLLAHFKTIPLKPSPSRPRRRFSPVLVAAVASVLVLGFAAMLLPSLARSKSKGMHTWSLAAPDVDAFSAAEPGAGAQMAGGRLLEKNLSPVLSGTSIADQEPSEIVLPAVKAKGQSLAARGLTQTDVGGQLKQEFATTPDAIAPEPSLAFGVPAQKPQSERTRSYGGFAESKGDVALRSAEVSRSLLQQGLRNSAELAQQQAVPPAVVAPPDISGKPIQESSVQMRARYGLAGTGEPTAAAKGPEVQERAIGNDSRAGTPIGLGATETAVNESVLRPSDELMRRQKLAGLNRAEQEAEPIADGLATAATDANKRVPILGDKPLMGRAYGEQPKLGKESMPELAKKSELAVNGRPEADFFSKDRGDALARRRTLSDNGNEALGDAIKTDLKNIEAYTELNRVDERESKLAEGRGAESREGLADQSFSRWSASAGLRGYNGPVSGGLEKAAEPANGPISSRVVKVDRNAFLQGIDSVTSFDLGSARDPNLLLGGSAAHGGGGGGGLLTTPRVNVAGRSGGTGGLPHSKGLTQIVETNNSTQIEAKARLFFRSMGIDLTPPNAVSWNDGDETLVLRASPQELDAVQTVVGSLGTGATLVSSNGTPRAPADAKLVRELQSASTNPAKAKLASKLNDIRLDSVSFDGLPLTDVIKILNDEAKRLDPEKRGINFLVNPNSESTATTPAAIDPATGLPLAAREPIDLSQVLVKIMPPLRDVRLSDVLGAIVKVADAPVDVSLEDYAVVVSPGTRKSSDLAELKIDLGKLQTSSPTNQQSDVTAPKPATPPPIPQPEIDTRENAFSTFSLNVSDVSFRLAAASLEKGSLPDPASIRSEEFINAFEYRDPEPPVGMPIGFASDRARYPFAQNRDLLRFSIKTAARGREPGRPLNLVILLDNSGSMERADRVQIIREALHVLAGQLQAQDKLSLITFARTAQLRVDGASGSQGTNVADEVSGLTPEGGTNLEEAMNLAYATARKHYLANGVNRVVLLTDGAANLGDVEPENLKKKVEDHRKQGIALDCFGIGWEGYNDDLLEVLSRNGDGRYGFINTPEEATSEFAAQLAGALHVAASDVKVQVEFNPRRVSAWRQIGYAKHQLTKEQFRDNAVDAAEIGAAESGNALYVVEVNPTGEGPLATVRARFKVPGTADYREHEWTVAYSGNAAPLEQAASAIRLAGVASGLSEWLARSPYAAEISPDALLNYLRGIPEAYGLDPRPQKLEWMIRQVKSWGGK